MLLGVQVDATRPLLDGHDGEADVDAAVKFALLDLRQVIDTTVKSQDNSRFTQNAQSRSCVVTL